MRFSLRLASVIFSTAILAIASASVLAQSYPDKPIRLVVPYTPGGATDIVARVVGQKLGESLGQQVVIDNRPGGGTLIGTDIVAKATPDGYTLLMCAATLGTNPSLYEKLPYDTLKDFAPVSLVAIVPNILVVHPSLPVKSVQQLIEYAKANPGKLSFASTGNGGSSHLAGELFKSMAGVDMVHVPYKGSAPAHTDVLGGRVPVMFDSAMLPHIKAGKVRALAVTTLKRSPAAPELPTLAESGLPGYEAVAWFGVLAPAGVPKQIVNKLSSEIVRIVHMPDVQQRFDSLAAEPIGNTPDEFATYIKEDIEKWAKVIKAANIRLD
jgi:tripartite-type tricarboxylate transporter receptor subunit TctC